MKNSAGLVVLPGIVIPLLQTGGEYCSLVLAAGVLAQAHELCPSVTRISVRRNRNSIFLFTPQCLIASTSTSNGMTHKPLQVCGRISPGSKKSRSFQVYYSSPWKLFVSSLLTRITAHVMACSTRWVEQSKQNRTMPR